jgi:hypothetical protein
MKSWDQPDHVLLGDPETRNRSMEKAALEGGFFNLRLPWEHASSGHTKTWT